LEDLVMCVASSRGKVDTLGAVAGEVFQSPCVIFLQGLEAKALAREHQYHLLLRIPGLGQCET